MKEGADREICFNWFFMFLCFLMCEIVYFFCYLYLFSVFFEMKDGLIVFVLYLFLLLFC